jgi:hypothetical protein
LLNSFRGGCSSDLEPRKQNRRLENEKQENEEYESDKYKKKETGGKGSFHNIFFKRWAGNVTYSEGQVGNKKL